MSAKAGTTLASLREVDMGASLNRLYRVTQGVRTYGRARTNLAPERPGAVAQRLALHLMFPVSPQRGERTRNTPVAFLPLRVKMPEIATFPFSSGLSSPKVMLPFASRANL